MGQDETRVIACFFTLSVPWISTPENKYMEIVKGIGGPLTRDAPGDNQFLDTFLSPEHIKPRDSPGFSLLGKADMPHCC